jgi:isopentenyl-diphosphate delta-isomerase
MSFQKDHVILVNERDEWVGSMEKMEAHRKGVLHRAFSIFVMNNKGEMLIQQRAEGKYHSGGLWSNACCSHPSPGESTLGAAHRRLQEEMGFDCELQPLFKLKYKSDVSGDMVEHELDHIYLGYYNREVVVNPKEVKSYKYVALEKLREWIEDQPDQFTNWFRLAMPKFLEHSKEARV